MDSLTQITLGAAVGEAVLGRRIGNRAMVWGAIGGTIPDLDIIGNFFLDPIQALAFHRGITHSLVFSLVGGLLLAWLVTRLYQTRSHRNGWYKAIVSIANVLLVSSVLFGVYTLSGKSSFMLVILCAIGLYLGWRLYHFYLTRVPAEVDVSYGQWFLLFFLALSTHFVLDCFTSFGTQVFLPFSDYRVAFNTISVVDPIYTVPFIICVIIACNIRREKRSRRIANWVGIGLSSLYLLFTVFNKQYVDGIFERALAHRDLDVNRYRTSPAIFNNMLWNCVAESDSVFYAGLYSVFDSDPNLHYINIVPKGSEYAEGIRHLEEYHILQWFSEGYLIHTPTDSSLILSDIRFGGMRDTITSPNDLVFNFHATPQPDGSYEFTETRARPDNVGAEFRALWERIKGR
jgi:inner membrane protein